MQARVSGSRFAGAVGFSRRHDRGTLLPWSSHGVTEDGAEAVALAYVSSRAGWVMKRRLQQKEHADWLLQNDKGWLALEVSGTAEGEPSARLKEKKEQAGRCSLTAERLAVVVAFNRPTILADTP